MKVISTNIGSEKTIEWRGTSITTGIYKEPVEGPIYLDFFAVKSDYINNKEVHGGIDKACYCYSEDYYDYWKSLYPDLNWTFGMFGENLTVSGMDEAEIMIGDIYKMGESVVQVSQPRQPCNKFAAKFRATELISQFIDFEHPGVYLRVIQQGYVSVGDDMKLDLRNERALSVRQIYQLLYSKKDVVDKKLAEVALLDANLSKSAKDDIRRHWKV